MSSNLANRVAASIRRLLCKSGLQAFKAGGNNGCLGADSKPEVIGHAEKLTRHDVSLIALVQHIHEAFRITAFQARKDTRSKLRPHALEFVTAIQKLANKFSIFRQERPGSLPNAIEVVECDDAEQFGWMWRKYVRGSNFRIDAQYVTGKSDEYEFFNQSESRMGWGLWYGNFSGTLRIQSSP